MKSGDLERHLNGQRTNGDIRISNEIVMVKKLNTYIKRDNRKKTHKDYICSQKSKYQTESDAWRYQTNKNTTPEVN